jgi:hypothetical protein
MQQQCAGRMAPPAVWQVFAVTLWTLHLGVRARASVTPLGKVTELLAELIEKGRVDMHDEQVRFASFQQWCRSTSDEKSRSIEAGTQRIEQRSADALRANSDMESLGSDVADLDAGMVARGSESDKAKARRDSEHAQYANSHQDFSEAMDAVQRALVVLRSRQPDVKQALLEVRRASALAAPWPRLAEDARKAVLLAAAAASANSGGRAGGAPQANAYEFQSGSVVELLEDLHERFHNERSALEKDETNRKYAHNLFMQKLEDTQTAAKATRAEKAIAKAQATQDLAEAQNDLNELKSGKQADETYLHEAQAVCEQKSTDFKSRQKLRAEELEAMRKAQELISSQTVTAPAAEHLPALLQRRADSRSLAQIRSKTNGAVSDWAQRQAQVSSLLAARAKDSGSQLLATIANRAGEDPFVKVKQMITDLLARLTTEADQEASHKDWCDGELANNEKTRKDRTAEASTLTSRVEELTALEAKLSQKIEDLSGEIAELDAAVSEATRARNEERAKNALTVQEAKGASAAVMQAIKVLKEFYAKASGATALVQQPSASEDAPHVFDEAYTGMQGENTGVVGLLEVIQTDFARLETDTSAAEATAQRDYEAFSEASAIDKREKETESRQTGFQKVRATRDLNTAKTDLEATQTELDAALEYYEKLKPSCIGEAANYGDRVAMREAEIASLQEALRVLEGEISSAPAS